MLRATADTNIYISGLNFGGNPRDFLRLAAEGGFRLAISDRIMAEIGEVLRGDTFQWPEAKIERALRQIARMAQHVTPRREFNVVQADPADNRILECAAAAQSDYLVTGDAHLLRLQTFERIRIVRVADFIRLVRAELSY